MSHRENLKQSDELLFRQVNPKWLKPDGSPQSVAFKPFPKDLDGLSVDRSSLTTAEKAFILFTEMGFSSAGTWGVSVQECTEESLTVVSDPVERVSTESQIANPAHALIVFSGLSKNQKTAVARRLAKKASQRGVLYSPLQVDP